MFCYHHFTERLNESLQKSRTLRSTVEFRRTASERSSAEFRRAIIRFARFATFLGGLFGRVAEKLRRIRRFRIIVRVAQEFPHRRFQLFAQYIPQREVDAVEIVDVTEQVAGFYGRAARRNRFVMFSEGRDMKVGDERETRRRAARMQIDPNANR